MTYANWIYSLKTTNNEIESEQVQVQVQGITCEEEQQISQIKYGQ